MKQLLTIFCLVALSFILFFPAQNLYATNLDECLMEAVKYADDSVTVGQLREQCQEETGTISSTKPSRDSSTVENSSDGPKEMVLKTVQARKPAYFPHKRHQDKYTCGKCHHGKNSSGMLVQYTAETTIYKCTACHNTDLPNKELNDFQSIGHQLCRECHRKNQDITSAKCSTCHRKIL